MADLDILSGDSFDELYGKSIEPELKLREVDRKKAAGTFWLIMLAGVLLVVVEALMAGPRLARAPQLWVVTLVLAGVLGCAFRLPASPRRPRSMSSARWSDRWASSISWRQFRADWQFAAIPRSAAAAQAHQRQIRGPASPASAPAGRSRFASATLTQGSGRNRSVVFRGQMFRLAFPRRFGGVTVVLRNSGWFSRFECPAGLGKVGLEDPVFNHSYAVFGSVQVEARAILTPTFMEQLTALETAAYAGASIRYAFTGTATS